MTDDPISEARRALAEMDQMWIAELPDGLWNKIKQALSNLLSHVGTVPEDVEGVASNMSDMAYEWRRKGQTIRGEECDQAAALLRAQAAENAQHRESAGLAYTEVYKLKAKLARLTAPVTGDRAELVANARLSAAACAKSVVHSTRLAGKKIEALADEVDRLREALASIRDGHIPDQPMTSNDDGLLWAQRWVGALRRRARDALSGEQGDKP